MGTALRLRAAPRFLETILDMTGVTGLLTRPVGGEQPVRTGPDGRPTVTA